MAVWIAASVPLGPNALNCMATSSTYGFRRGLWSVAGVMIAASIHMSVAVSGLATLMAAHPLSFEVIRWLGVVYLMWMGMKLLRGGRNAPIKVSQSVASRRRLVGNAILISLSNPKAIFAWLAVFSQFIDPQAPLGGQLLVLAPSALSVTILVYGGYSLLGRGMARFIAGRTRVWFDRLAGATYICFAGALAAADLRRG